MDRDGRSERGPRSITHWSDPHNDALSIVDGSGVLVGAGRPATQVVLSAPLIADADDLSEGVAAVESVFP